MGAIAVFETVFTNFQELASGLNSVVWSKFDHNWAYITLWFIINSKTCENKNGMVYPWIFKVNKYMANVSKYIQKILPVIKGLVLNPLDNLQQQHSSLPKNFTNPHQHSHNKWFESHILFYYLWIINLYP